jgi:hypothetical protein
VVLLAGAITLGLAVWAVAPAIIRAKNPPPGDGKTIESYAFDLTGFSLPRELIFFALRMRDMVPTLESPTHHDAESAQRFNDPKYGKYMVSDDVVVGVVINGQARAYPIHVLNVHEIINDSLGEPPVPIAVTYSWPSDAVRVFDRRVDGRVLEFGVSGMLYNANTLMFDVRRDDAGKPIVGGESLWLQLQSKCVAGPDAGKTLSVIPAQMVRWSDWLEAHPESTIVDRDLRLDKRYKDGSPTQYFLDSKFPFPFSPQAPPSAVDPKDRIIAVQANGQRRVYPLAIISARATNGTFEDELGGVRIIFHPHREKQTVYLTTDPPDADVQWTHALWYVWHAMFPDDPLMTAAPAAAVE